MSRFARVFAGRPALRATPLALGAFAVMALLPGVTAAQQSGSAGEEELQQVLGELRELNEKLAEVHAKAMEDPQLQNDQEALGAEIKAAMESADPELGKSLERMASLEVEAATAQQSNDTAKLQQLVREAEAIQVRFEQVRNQVLEEPTLAKKIGDYQNRVEQKMLQVDPTTPDMIRRYQELEAKVASVLSPGQ